MFKTGHYLRHICESKQEGDLIDLSTNISYNAELGLIEGVGTSKAIV